MLVRLLIILKTIITFIFFSPFSHAAPPSTVYRVDSREPEIIFEEGFRAWGEEMSIIYHFHSVQHFTENDIDMNGMVSTSTDLDESLSFSEMLSFNDEDIDLASHSFIVWLYEIRANSDTYDVDASLNEAIRIANEDGDKDRAARLQGRLTSFGGMSEWVHEGSITPNLIRSAREVRVYVEDDGYGNWQVITGSATMTSVVINNNQFDGVESQGNPNPFDMTNDQFDSSDNTTSAIISTVGGASGGPVAWGMVGDFSCESDEFTCVSVGLSENGTVNEDSFSPETEEANISSITLLDQSLGPLLFYK